MTRGRWTRGTRLVGTVCVAVALGAPMMLLTVPTAVAAPAAAGTSGTAVHPTDLVVGSAAPKATHPKSTSDSLDWAGYAVTGPAVASVSGSWVQPAVACPTTKLQQSAFWVGIDGYAASDPTVQQVGTDADCTKGSKKHPGGPLYYAWFEMYPAPLVTLDTSRYPVAPGDLLSASVTDAGTSYVLTIVDQRSSWTFTSTQPVTTPPPLDSSAEWIAEAPTACKGTSCKALPLADFGSVSFAAASVNGLPVVSPGQTTSEITMTKNKKGTVLKASTSALDPTDHDFTVTWLGN